MLLLFDIWFHIIIEYTFNNSIFLSWFNIQLICNIKTWCDFRCVVHRRRDRLRPVADAQRTAQCGRARTFACLFHPNRNNIWLITLITYYYLITWFIIIIISSIDLIWILFIIITIIFIINTIQLWVHFGQSVQFNWNGFPS